MNISDFICKKNECGFYDADEEKVEELYRELCSCPFVCRRRISLIPDMFVEGKDKQPDAEVSVVWTM